MKINIDGKEVETYRLITQRKFAELILNGSKTVEIRSFTDFYNRLFIDSEKLELFEAQGEGNESMNFDDTVKDTRFVRFTNYGNTWYLDVEIYLPHIVTVCQEDADFLRVEYGFTDLLNDVETYKDLPFEEKPIVFAIPIKKIVASKGL